MPGLVGLRDDVANEEAPIGRYNRQRRLAEVLIIRLNVPQVLVAPDRNRASMLPADRHSQELRRICS